MERKEEELAKLALEYMDYLEEIVGVPGYEDYVVDIVNDIHTVITGDERPIIDVKYIDISDPDDIDGDREDYIEGMLDDVFGKEGKEEKFYPLGNSNSLGDRMADTFDGLIDLYEEMIMRIDQLEHDKEYLVEKNASLVGQATELVLELGNKDDRIEMLTETIDNIFDKGDFELEKILFEKVERIEEDIKLPERSTQASAGYDFFAVEDITIPGKSDTEEYGATLVKTGVKAKFPEDMVLNLFSRSSMAIKHGIILPNSVGVIDADYYGNESNDGEIMFAYINLSKEPYEIKKGDKIGQGVFQKYFTTVDDKATGKRKGGVGSTGK